MSIKAEAPSFLQSMRSYVHLFNDVKMQLHGLLVEVLKGFENQE